MTEQLLVVANAIGFVGFAVAAVVLATVPADKDSFLNPLTKWFVFSALMVYVYVTASDTFDALGFDLWIDAIEDYVELLFPILVLVAVFSAYSHQQIGDLRRSQQALRSSHNLMMGIVDAAPAGILFIDVSGAIAFANQAAKEILDLEEDEFGHFDAPWFAGRERPDALLPAISKEHQVGVKIPVDWPNGWHVDLVVNTEPLVHAAGEMGGVVATFERPAGITRAV